MKKTTENVIRNPLVPLGRPIFTDFTKLFASGCSTGLIYPDFSKFGSSFTLHKVSLNWEACKSCYRVPGLATSLFGKTHTE